MAVEQSNVQQQIITKAMKDEVFRQQLLSNPQETLERVVGVTLQGVTIHVYEDTPSVIHLVLPMQLQTGESVELSDTDLEAAVGGVLPAPTADCSVTTGAR